MGEGWAVKYIQFIHQQNCTPRLWVVDDGRSRSSGVLPLVSYVVRRGYRRRSRRVNGRRSQRAPGCVWVTRLVSSRHLGCRAVQSWRAWSRPTWLGVEGCRAHKAEQHGCHRQRGTRHLRTTRVLSQSHVTVGINGANRAGGYGVQRGENGVTVTQRC